MLRVALATAKVVVLVGPPGTGKGTILKHIVAQVAASPTAFGFSTAHARANWPDPIRKTPDDTWSAFELIGGPVPSGAGLQWAGGEVLNALAEDRWLILDELNRAELDKIFGPLLTWLASERVTLGPVAPGQHSGSVHLDWNESVPECSVSPPQGLTAAKGDVEFIAGSDWRLLGTYNPKDADRVFGIGQALGRRLRQVPIPAMNPDAFDTYLPTAVPTCPQPSLIADMYREQHQSARLQLGPALFIDLARYVGEAVQRHGVPQAEAIAEGYVICMGHFVSGFRAEDQLALLSSGAFVSALGGEVPWMQQQLGNLR